MYEDGSEWMMTISPFPFCSVRAPTSSSPSWKGAKRRFQPRKVSRGGGRRRSGPWRASSCCRHPFSFFSKKKDGKSDLLKRNFTFLPARARKRECRKGSQIESGSSEKWRRDGTIFFQMCGKLIIRGLCNRDIWTFSKVLFLISMPAMKMLTASSSMTT